jgi:hypothetical protein
MLPWASSFQHASCIGPGLAAIPFHFVLFREWMTQNQCRQCLPLMCGSMARTSWSILTSFPKSETSIVGMVAPAPRVTRRGGGHHAYELRPPMPGTLTVLLLAIWVVPAATLIYVDWTDRFLPIRMLLAAAGVFSLALPLAISSYLAPLGHAAMLVSFIVSLEILNLKYRPASLRFQTSPLMKAAHEAP